MLAVERHRQILDMLQKSGAVATATVALALDISEETVRRDFETLEAEGLLSRRHGGAVLLNESHRDLSLNSREIANVPEKKIIAELAVAQIQPGDTLFFDASSTVFHLACILPNLEITVVTSALKIVAELVRRPSIQVILCGGLVNPRSLSCQGALADPVLDRCHVQKAFLSCRALEAERGLSEANIEQANIKRKVMALADQTIVLADHSKMSIKSSYFFAKLDEVDALITDRKPANALKLALQRGGGKLLLPKEK